MLERIIQIENIGKFEKYSCVGDVSLMYRFKGFGHFVMETSTTRIDYTPAI
jgi:hypothetical protein